MKYQFKEITEKKKKWLPRWTLGAHLISSQNKNNNIIKSKFLTLFGIISIGILILLMLSSIFLFGLIIFHKLTTPEDTIITKTSAVGLIVPSIKTNSIKEISQEAIEVANNERDVQTIQKRFLIWIPIVLFLPIIFITTFVHELGHYIMCRRAKVKIKRYGFGAISVLGVPLLPFAFVEPTKKGMKETSRFNYFSIISAGVAMNVILSALMIPIVFYNQFTQLLFFFNISVALTNSLPVLILDGGQFVRGISNKLNYITTAFTVLLLFLLVI